MRYASPNTSVLSGVLDGVDAQCRVGGTMDKADARKCALLIAGTVRQANLLGALGNGPP
jgi:hypothetical protein